MEDDGARRREREAPVRDLPGGAARAATRGENLRQAWLFLTYALAGDILYRAGFGRQRPGQIADLVVIWLAAELYYTVRELGESGVTLAAFWVSAFPTFVLAIIVAGGALLLSAFWTAGVVAAAATTLSLVVVMVLLAALRRRV